MTEIMCAHCIMHVVHHIVLYNRFLPNSVCICIIYNLFHDHYFIDRFLCRFANLVCGYLRFSSLIKKIMFKLKQNPDFLVSFKVVFLVDGSLYWPIKTKGTGYCMEQFKEIRGGQNVYETNLTTVITIPLGPLN